MYAELRGKGQLTVPSEIVKKLGLSSGSVMEVSEKDGSIVLTPVIMCPRKDIEEALEDAKSKDLPHSINRIIERLGKQEENCNG